MVLLDAALSVPVWAADSIRLDPKEVYAKKATWAETMIATRLNCAEWARGAREGELVSTPLPAVWVRIRKDFPTQCAWFQQDLPSNRYLDWFLQKGNTGFEQWIMGRTLARLAGFDAGLKQELAGLARGRTPATDPHWLELYTRARCFEPWTTGDWRCNPCARGLIFSRARPVFARAVTSPNTVPRAPTWASRWRCCVRRRGCSRTWTGPILSAMPAWFSPC
jgi:hypothetical protein